jgi:adenylate cyclase
VIEDAHWIDDASHFLLARIAHAGTRPWLICVTRRPEGPSFVNGAGSLLALEPLPPEASARLALAAAEDLALSEDALATLAERSGGNPLFVTELIAASRRGDSLEALPERVETLITTRIDTLDPGDRLLLRYASVIGPSFDLGLLREILAEQPVDVDDLARWDRLAEFVSRVDGDELRFRHDLFRAVAYEALAVRRRREVHGRVAEALERRAAENVDAFAAVLSLHFFSAARYEDA